MIKGFNSETAPLTEYEETVILPLVLQGLRTKIGKPNAASFTYAHIGSRLCFRDRRLAYYAGNTFTDLYAAILVENF